MKILKRQRLLDCLRMKEWKDALENEDNDELRKLFQFDQKKMRILAKKLTLARIGMRVWGGNAVFGCFWQSVIFSTARIVQASIFSMFRRGLNLCMRRRTAGLTWKNFEKHAGLKQIARTKELFTRQGRFALYEINRNWLPNQTQIS